MTGKEFIEICKDWAKEHPEENRALLQLYADEFLREPYKPYGYSLDTWHFNEETDNVN